METGYNFIKNRKLLYIGVLEITTEKEQDWYNLMLISDLSVLLRSNLGHIENMARIQYHQTANRHINSEQVYS